LSNSTTLVAGIKLRLRAQGLSYSDLAKRLGLSEPTVKRDLSRGKFTLARLDLICEALGVDIVDLLQPPGNARSPNSARYRSRRWWRIPSCWW